MGDQRQAKRFKVEKVTTLPLEWASKLSNKKSFGAANGIFFMADGVSAYRIYVLVEQASMVYHLIDFPKKKTGDDGPTKPSSLFSRGKLYIIEDGSAIVHICDLSGGPPYCWKIGSPLSSPKHAVLLAAVGNKIFAIGRCGDGVDRHPFEVLDASDDNTGWQVLPDPRFQDPNLTPFIPVSYTVLNWALLPGSNGPHRPLIFFVFNYLGGAVGDRKGVCEWSSTGDAYLGARLRTVVDRVQVFDPVDNNWVKHDESVTTTAWYLDAVSRSYTGNGFPVMKFPNDPSFRYFTIEPGVRPAQSVGLYTFDINSFGPSIRHLSFTLGHRYPPFNLKLPRGQAPSWHTNQIDPALSPIYNIPESLTKWLNEVFATCGNNLFVVPSPLRAKINDHGLVCYQLYVVAFEYHPTERFHTCSFRKLLVLQVPFPPPMSDSPILRSRFKLGLKLAKVADKNCIALDGLSSPAIFSRIP